MVAPLLNERDLDFLLYELFDVESLTNRERYTDHNRESYDAAVRTGKTIAYRYLLPIRKQVDVQQPEFDGEKVTLLADIGDAVAAIMESGLVSSRADYEQGGMQLPHIVANVANAYPIAACCSLMGYPLLTSANANLIEYYGTPEQKKKWVEPMRAGRYMGTMAMTEPGAGSGLADLTTRAERDEEGSYRITGNKIFISGGDHDLSENIIHLVLARIKGAPKGVHGISLFIVPKFLVDDDGVIGERNDVQLSGLFHKMGGHGHVSTALNFGDKDGAIGYLVGEENKGLHCMFHMMNEARIFVGTSAAVTGLAGFQYSLDYARERLQGRLPDNKDPETKPVRIIEHADVRRMLLAQKVYAEGAYTLCLFGETLLDDSHTALEQAVRDNAGALLDLLTPVIKSWPSEYGPRANSLAIQVLGGHGYINEHPVEMFYRDNRLNPIHEGTYAIQSLDLLGRKVSMNDKRAFRLLLDRITKTIILAREHKCLNEYTDSLAQAVTTLTTTTDSLLAALKRDNRNRVLANSVKYLELFGHVVIAWLWLKQGELVCRTLPGVVVKEEQDFYHGKLQALQYFYRYELPKIQAWARLLNDGDTTSYDMHPDWF